MGGVKNVFVSYHSLLSILRRGKGVDVLEDVGFFGDREGITHLAKHVILWLATIGDMLDHQNLAFPALPFWVLDGNFQNGV